VPAEGGGPLPSKCVKRPGLQNHWVGCLTTSITQQSHAEIGQDNQRYISMPRVRGREQGGRPTPCVESYPPRPHTKTCGALRPIPELLLLWALGLCWLNRLIYLLQHAHRPSALTMPTSSLCLQRETVTAPPVQWQHFPRLAPLSLSCPRAQLAHPHCQTWTWLAPVARWSTQLGLAPGMPKPRPQP
jgi:hypothetical protein